MAAKPKRQRMAKSLGTATRRNVHESHGALAITSCRALDPESVYAKKVCDGLSMPWLHVVIGDYNQQTIRRFIQENWIERLYVVGDDAVTRHQCEAVLDVVSGAWSEFEIMILASKVC
ncbi:YpsA SLOG family protein [Nitrosomonas halophila]|nr:putative molybdenum carrier protein [Nitrosomonas halophila]